MSILTDNSNNVNRQRHFKREGCPVCSKKDRRCRESFEDSIVCWNSTRADIDQNIWYVIKEISGKGFGMQGLMVALKRGAEYKERDQDALQLEREIAKQNRSLELANLPSVESRDRGYREVLNGMILNAEHAKGLTERGLTEEQIELAERLYWFKTWKVGLKTQENIAGIDPGTGATRWFGGMFITTLDGSGKILGGQIAADKPDAVGKYFWISSSKIGGYGCQLQFTNSLPLFVRKHPDSVKTSQIWLCEGGIKSAVTALKAWETDINIIVVGTAMSARFSDQLADIIADLIPEDGKRISIKVMPDAGTLYNPAILTSVLMTLEQVKKLGYSPLVGWWKQWAKEEESPDIDDYLMQNSGDFSKIEWLTIAQFMQLNPENRENIRADGKEKIEEPKEEKLQEKFSTNPAYRGYLANSIMKLPDESVFGNLLTNQATLATVVSLEKEGEITEELGEGEGQIGWEFYPPRPGEILFIKAGTGTGKSHLVAHWMNEYYSERGCIFLGYRNGLLYQQCDKVKNLEHLRAADADGFLRLLDPYYRVAFCDASLHTMKEKGGTASEKILVIDEVTSVLQSLYLGKTCSSKRRTRVEVFEKMLLDAEMVICLDAHLAQWCVDLLTKLSNKVARKMQNEWEGEPRKVKMFLGTETNPNDKKAIRREIIEAAKDNRAIAVFSDSKLELETLHKLMVKENVEERSILRIDSSTSGFPWCQECLRNIDKYLEEHPEIKILLVSPSGDSGLDISRKYFEKVFLILFGTLTIDSALQMYGRVRDNSIPRTIFCTKDAPFLRDGGLTSGAVGAEIRMSIESQLKLICEGSEPGEDLNKLLTQAVGLWQERDKELLHENAVTIMLAKANFEKVYYRDLLIARLSSRGDIVELVHDASEGSDLDGKFKEASYEVKEESAVKFVAADVLNEIQAEALRRKDLNPDQQMALRKYDCQRRIPGVEIDQNLAKTLLYDNSFMKGLEQRFYLSYPIVSVNMAKTQWSSALAKRELFTADLRSTMRLKTDYLNRLGIVEFLDDRIWLENGSEVKTLRKNWESLQKEVGDKLKNTMGFDWDKTSPSKTVYRLLDLVGCDWRVIKKKSGEDKNSPKQRKITFGSLNDPIRLAILESFNIRFDDLKDENWTVDLRTAAINEVNLAIAIELEIEKEKVKADARYEANINARM